MLPLRLPRLLSPLLAAVAYLLAVVMVSPLTVVVVSLAAMVNYLLAVVVVWLNVCVSDRVRVFSQSGYDFDEHIIFWKVIYKRALCRGVVGWHGLSLWN